MWERKQIKQKRAEQSDRWEIRIKARKNSKMIMGDSTTHNSRVEPAGD